MVPFKVQKYVERFGFFTKKGPDITREQIGTVRTNCTDCLDRTNCVQTFLGLEVLQYSLMDLGKVIYPKYYKYYEFCTFAVFVPFGSSGNTYLEFLQVCLLSTVKLGAEAHVD